METKVIAIDWTINTWKSSLIKNTGEFYTALDANVKVYPEVARWVMSDFPGSENDQNIFQDII